MKICIIDDNKKIAEGIKLMLLKNKDYKNIIDEELEIDVCFSSKDFYNLSKETKFNICFLDINLEEESINGLGLAKFIKRTNYRCLLIFVSSFDDYYRDVVQVEPFRFLKKPFKLEELYYIFIQACERIVLENNRQSSYLYNFTYNGLTHSVDLTNIIYIYSLKRKIYFVDGGKDKSEKEFYGKLDIVEEEINNMVDFFIRINKSILINKNYIESYGKNEVFINDEKLSISPKYKNNVLRKLKL